MMLLLIWMTGYFLFGILIFLKLHKKQSKHKINTQVRQVTVVIPFRNEREQLPTLLHCMALIETQHQVTWCFVNDHSTDGGEELLQNNQADIQLLALPKDVDGKNQALQLGINHAQSDVIICIDADVTFSQNWLDSLISPIVNNMSDWVIGGVTLQTGRENTYTKMQKLEWKALQRLTHYFALLQNPILCNGANLAFDATLKPCALKALDNQKSVSGDDLMLMTYFNQAKAKVTFVNGDGSVSTSMPENVASFLQQKSRWMKKMKNQWSLTSLVGLFFLLTPILLIISMLSQYFQITLLVFVFKYVADCLIAQVFQWRNIPYWLLLQIYPLILWFAQPFITLSWKGRYMKS